ncbi:hypothetical protein V502_03763 [Pseudogymnoascus sp. VKM F-4520 (FW-2644)]|nr:hypothetical protein V502_03763 [Pseudogymnoascus sp. VKM F-4520 (FW-2644)]
MRGYGATVCDEGDYEVFAYDEMDVDELPNCVVNGDIATFKFFTEKPELPYTVGSCLKAHPHTPQPPDNSNFPGYEFDYNPKSEKNTVRPFQRCLLHPPWPGKTEAGEVEFKIVDWVQAGDPNDAQVVAIRILNSTVDLPTDMDILAKIYDPLYFNHIKDVEMFRYTDYCYRRESAAYKHLADLQGNIIPKYYGSFTISLPGDGNISRDVRLILLEIVTGQSMDKLDPSSFKQAERQEIMKAVVDSERAVYARKVINRDINPRNILLPPKQRHRDRRAVMVDFGISFIKPDLDDKTYLTGLADPPKSFHCIDPYDNFWEWVDWDWDAWINEQYAHIKGSSITPREESKIYVDNKRRTGYDSWGS